MTRESLPIPVSDLERQSFDSILSVPWLKDSVVPTGLKWGRRIADVKMSHLPDHLIGQVMLIPSDEKDLRSVHLTDEIRIVIYRCDRYDYLGWVETFSVTLTFPDETVYEVEIPPSFRLIDGHSLRVSVNTGTPVRERAQQLSRSIPRVIYNLSAPATKQISQDVVRLLKNVRRMANLLQCTSLYLVLEDDACRKEIEASGIPHFVEAYNALRAPSYKADLVRYYLLYKYGGVYLDDKTQLNESLDSSLFDSILGGEGMCDLFICTHKTPEIAFMAARQGSPIMLKALQTAIGRVVNREYTKHRLGITGNYLFTETMTQNGGNPLNILSANPIGVKWVSYWGERCALLPIIFSNDGILVNRRFLWRRQVIPTSDWPKPPSHYKSLWSQRMVFADGNPPPSIISNIISSRGMQIALQVTITLVILISLGFIISRFPPIKWI